MKRDASETTANVPVSDFDGTMTRRDFCQLAIHQFSRHMAGSDPAGAADQTGRLHRPDLAGQPPEGGGLVAIGSATGSLFHRLTASLTTKSRSRSTRRDAINKKRFVQRSLSHVPTFRSWLPPQGEATGEPGRCFSRHAKGPVTVSDIGDVGANRSTGGRASGCGVSSNRAPGGRLVVVRPQASRTVGGGIMSATRWLPSGRVSAVLTAQLFGPSALVLVA